MKNDVFLLIAEWDDPIEGVGKAVLGVFAFKQQAQIRLQEYVYELKKTYLSHYFSNDTPIEEVSDYELIEEKDLFLFSDNTGNGTYEEVKIVKFKIE